MTSFMSYPYLRNVIKLDVREYRSVVSLAKLIQGHVVLLVDIITAFVVVGVHL